MRVKRASRVGACTHWVKSGYGPDGHRVRVESSDGHLHHIERNLGGDVTRVELEGAWWGVDFERDPLGLELGRAFPSSVSSGWERDLVGRPMRRTVIARGADGSTRTMGDKRYQWEGDDQIRAILDPQLGDAHYKHDARGRLVWAKLPWGEPQHRAMDAVGNIYRTPDLSDRRYGPGGRIEEAEGTRYVHDDDGNLVEKSDILGDTTRYRWNGAGMLSAVELPDGREVSFAYDVLARRLTRQVSETKGAERPLKEVRWSWDGHTPLTELDSDEGKTTWVFEPETFNPLAKLAEGQVWGVLTDQIGTPTELIAQHGTVAWRGEIDTYGKMVSEVKRTKCPFRWPGQMEDDESGLSYNMYRHYSGERGAYTSEDPLGLDGGYRTRSYVIDVLNACDPLGLIERLFRYVSEGEARQSAGNMGGDNNLHPRPHGRSTGRGAKWITEAGSPPRVQGTRPTHRLDIEVEDGTTQWLRDHGIDYRHVLDGEGALRVV